MSATDVEPVTDRAFHVEKRGIDYIPDNERWGKPRDLFGMWAGASFQVEYFVYGIILMATLPIDFAQAIVVIIIGNLSFLALGVTSMQGPLTGTTTMTITRASYGTNGSRVIALFNWLTQVGFETEGLILVVYAAEILMLKAGFIAGTPAKVLLILGAVAVQLALPVLGHATILKTLRLLIVPFIALWAVLAGLTIGKFQPHAVAHGGDWRTLMVAFAFTITLSGLGWTENGNDYSRYLPRDSSKRSILFWVFLGTGVPEILIMILGAGIGTYAPKVATEANPFAALVSTHAIASGFVVPMLIVAILQLFAINSLDLYSSGVTLQALGLGVRRWQAVLIDTAIACAMTFYAVFSSSFSTLLFDFVSSVICWIAPWLAIFVVDWILRRFLYAPHELQRVDRGGLYFRSSGINWPGVIAQAVGTFLAVESISQPFFVGQIARWIGPNKLGIFPDFSIYIAMAASALVYLALGTRSVRAQAKRQLELGVSR